MHEMRDGRRRFRRIVLIVLGSLASLVSAGLIIGYAYVNHMASSIPRVQVGHLAAEGAGAETILLTISEWGITGTTTQKPSPPHISEVVMLLHLNGDHRSGAVVGMTGDTVADVPGVGTVPMWRALHAGGPTLLVQTLTQLTGIPIQHYARIDFNHIGDLVDALGGVEVTLPEATTAFGYTFQKGVNHLTGDTAIYYARQRSLTQQGRLHRWQSLLRAVLDKIASQHLATNPAALVNVLRAADSMLTVDSSLTGSHIESLANQLSGLSSKNATFVNVPTRTVNGQVLLNTALSDQLWTAIKRDSVAEFAMRYPSTVPAHAAPLGEPTPSLGQLNEQLYRQYGVRKVIFAPHSVDDRRFAAEPATGRSQLLAQWGLPEKEAARSHHGDPARARTGQRGFRG